MMQMWQKEHCDRAFATDKVTSTGQIIAGIVGTSKRIAQKAASLGIFHICKHIQTIPYIISKIEVTRERPNS